MTSAHNGRYVLDGHVPRPEPDLLTWGRWMQKSNAERRVALTDVATGVQVSTVFLGLDHAFVTGGRPVLFETIIFGGPLGGDQDRYCTWEEAEAGHAAMVARAVDAGVSAGGSN